MASNEVNIKNKRARFEFFIEEEFTAGLKLAGTEIKSIRSGKASIMEAYCVWQDGELWIRNMYIAPYANASFYEHKTRGDRKLLLNRKELNRIEKFLKVKGNTIIPLKLFLSEKGWLKVNNFKNSNNKFAYAYLLTPSGIEEKALLTVSYLKRKIEEYYKINFITNE